MARVGCAIPTSLPAARCISFPWPNDGGLDLSYHDGKSMSHTATRLALSAHLKRLEAESIGIIREVAAEFRNPVMLYSIGKDSGVMLHLALKAFYPSKPPFP